jgi:hypothetical protein
VKFFIIIDFEVGEKFEEDDEEGENHLQPFSFFKNYLSNFVVLFKLCSSM